MSFLSKLQLDYRNRLAQEAYHLVNFTVSRGQELILWRSYMDLSHVIGLLSDDTLMGQDALRKYLYGNHGYEYTNNSISATQDGEWPVHLFYAGKDQSIFVCMKDQVQYSKVHGHYVAWSTNILKNVDATYKPIKAPSNIINPNYVSNSVTAQTVMQCRYCGGITNDVDIEYLSGTYDHLECKLKDEMAIQNGTTC